MRDNGSNVDPFSIDNLVKIYDTKFQGFLDYEDFLKMTLARDNPKTRFEAAATREIYDVGQDSLAEEIEYTLNRFFTKACEFVKKMKADAESQSIVSERDLFNQLGTHSGSLDFKILKKFFEELRIVPRDSEIIAILRVIDINDDGIIDKAEFDYFLSLFNSKLPSESILQKLRDRVKKDTDTNYFGERKREPASSERNKSSNRNLNTGSKERSYVSELRYESKGKLLFDQASSVLDRSANSRLGSSNVKPEERIVTSSYVKRSPGREEYRSKREVVENLSSRDRDLEKSRLSGDAPLSGQRSFVYEKTTTVTPAEPRVAEYTRTS